jgi:GNAT superfamily N-acetyltransferase
MIAMAGEPDFEPLIAHVARKRAERDHYTNMPYSRSEPFDRAAIEERYRTGWARRLDEVGWRRTWIVPDNGDIRGHLDLMSGRLASEMHLASLGMGIEASHRFMGHGRALLDAAIDWSRAHAWIDLGVFAGNAPARALYAKAGFVEFGTWRDRFRVDGEVIDDIAMPLAL